MAEMQPAAPASFAKIVGDDFRLTLPMYDKTKRRNQSLSLIAATPARSKSRLATL